MAGATVIGGHKGNATESYSRKKETHSQSIDLNNHEPNKRLNRGTGAWAALPHRLRPQATDLRRELPPELRCHCSASTFYPSPLPSLLFFIPSI